MLRVCVPFFPIFPLIRFVNLCSRDRQCAFPGSCLIIPFRRAANKLFVQCRRLLPPYFVGARILFLYYTANNHRQSAERIINSCPNEAPNAEQMTEKIGTKTNELQEKPRGNSPLANGGNFGPCIYAAKPSIPSSGAHTRTPPFVCMWFMILRDCGGKKQ